MIDHLILWDYLLFTVIVSMLLMKPFIIVYIHTHTYTYVYIHVSICRWKLRFRKNMQLAETGNQISRHPALHVIALCRMDWSRRFWGVYLTIEMAPSVPFKLELIRWTFLGQFFQIYSILLVPKFCKLLHFNLYFLSM